jgi:hypothetical protein
MPPTRGKSWFLDCRIDGRRHVVRLGRGSRGSAGARTKWARRSGESYGESVTSDACVARPSSAPGHASKEDRLLCLVGQRKVSAVSM